MVISLQTLLHRPFFVGGRTALELQGFTHYLTAAGPREVHLYGEGSPPGWVARLNLDATLVFHNARKLFLAETMPAGQNGHSEQASAESAHPDAVQGFVTQTWGHREWPLVMSSPERAVLELLDEVPQRETFHQADMLMEGLRTLSPKRLQTLLEDCRSVKVKRLFFSFADRHSHTWLDKLDRSRIDLGSGKRMLVRGGRLDPKYDITVPENLDGGV